MADRLQQWCWSTHKQRYEEARSRLLGERAKLTVRNLDWLVSELPPGPAREYFSGSLVVAKLGLADLAGAVPFRRRKQVTIDITDQATTLTEYADVCRLFAGTWERIVAERTRTAERERAVIAAGHLGPDAAADILARVRETGGVLTGYVWSETLCTTLAAVASPDMVRTGVAYCEGMLEYLEPRISRPHQEQWVRCLASWRDEWVRAMNVQSVEGTGGTARTWEELTESPEFLEVAVRTTSAELAARTATACAAFAEYLDAEARRAAAC